MKTVDFRGEIAPNGQITVPPEIASQVPPGNTVAVWREAGRCRFESAYVPSDAVYKQLIHDPAAK
jgi:hypothetical protein